MGAQGAGMEFFHGYTYSGHPLACAAALGALDTYEEENLFQAPQAKYFEDGVHSLKGLPNVVDCRNLGLIGAVELGAAPGRRRRARLRGFREVLGPGRVRAPGGRSVAFCPPLIAQKKHLDQMFGTVAEVLKTVG